MLEKSPKLNLKLKIVTTIVIILIFATFTSGCTSEEESKDVWDDVVSSYNRSKNKFEGYKNKVKLKGKIKTCVFVKKSDKTKFTFKSNQIPLHLDGSSVPNKNGTQSNLQNKYSKGDSITFVIHVETGEHGEYIKEMNKYWA